MPSLRELQYNKLQTGDASYAWRCDLIMAFKLTKGLEHVNRKGLLVKNSGKTSEQKVVEGHEHMLKKTRCRKDVKKFGRITDIWNRLDSEVIRGENIHEFKAQLYESRLEDRTQA